jgi:hypothetical protein
MRLDTGMVSTRTIGIVCRFSVAALFFVLGNPFPVFAQILPPTNLRYTFSVPVVKPVVNPCSTTFVLINGRTDLTIDTAAGTDFKIFVDYASTGGGADARADGTLISDGTQKADYVYSGDVKSEAGFPQKPLTFIASIPIVDYLERSSGGTVDAFLMSSLFEITFTNGVPGVPVLKALDVGCVVQ